MENDNTLPPAVSDHEMVKDMAKGLRFAVALMPLAAAAYCTQAVWCAPKFGKLYNDMLDPGTVLPVSARLLVEHHWSVLLLIAALGIVPAIAAWRVRSLLVVIVAGTLVTSLLVALGVCVSGALLSPLRMIIDGISR